MGMLLIGIVLVVTIGFACRWFDIPLPSPPNLVGALLVVAITLGFVSVNYFLSQPVITPALQEQKNEGL
jgi:XapX domain-containing protein